MTDTPQTSPPSADPARVSTTSLDDRAHVFHSWSAQALISPPVVASGEGSWFWDEDGNRLLDFASQLMNVNLGHQHPRLVEAIRRQAATLTTIAPGMATEARSTAARMIAQRTPGDLDKIFFTNGGAEATENATRMARLHTGRHKVLTTYRSYHGSTAGAIALTGDPRRWASEPAVVPGVVKFFGPYPYRSSFWSDSEAQECERALEHLDEVIGFEGPQQIAAIVLESVVGTNGILVPPDGYLQGVRDLCDRYGIVMICDEVMAGFGRCGEWFAVDVWDVVPDLITFAKGVNSGYVPLGGVAINAEIASTFDQRVYPGGLTYSGHVLACASVVESIRIFEDEDILARSRRLGSEVFGPGLERLAQRHPSVGDVRGLACFWAIELVKDRETREMFVPFNATREQAAPMTEVVSACRRLGLSVFAHFNRIHVAPPLVMTDDEARLGLDILDEALTLADAHVS